MAINIKLYKFSPFLFGRSLSIPSSVAVLFPPIEKDFSQMSLKFYGFKLQNLYNLCALLYQACFCNACVTLSGWLCSGQ